MSQTSLDPVRVALARYLNVDPEAVLPVHDLRADLKLYPLDLVLIALELERDGGSEFPIAWLDTVRTVTELSAITVAWMERVSRFRSASPVRPPGRRTRSRASDACSKGHLRNQSECHSSRSRDDKER